MRLTKVCAYERALCSTAHLYRPLFADRSMHLPAMMATEGDAVMIHESSVRDRGHHVYLKKSDWIEKYGDR